jgi:hypothetical protein
MVSIKYKGFELTGLEIAHDDIIKQFANIAIVSSLDPFTIAGVYPTGNKTNENVIYVFHKPYYIVATKIDDVHEEIYLNHVHVPIWKGMDLPEIIELDEEDHYKNCGYVVFFEGLNLDVPEPKKNLIPIICNNTNRNILVCMRWRSKVIVIGITDHDVENISSWNIEPLFIISDKLPSCTWFGKKIYIPDINIPSATYYAYVTPGKELSDPINIYSWYHNTSCKTNNYVLLVVTEAGISMPLAETSEPQDSNSVQLTEVFKILFKESGVGFHENRTGPTTDPVDLYKDSDYNKWYDFFFVHSSPQTRTDTAFHLLKNVPIEVLTPYHEELSVLFYKAEKKRLGY